MGVVFTLEDKMTRVLLLFNLATLDKPSPMTTELGQLIFLNIAL